MKTMQKLRTTGIFAMMLAFLTVSLQTPVMADMIDNGQLAMQAELQMQRDEVRSFIAREDVRSTLLDYGVDTADIDSRIDNLTESELVQIQDQLAQLPAGADGGVLGAILIVILIFVLLDVLGATDVFPRV
jgi:hypothetical protein